ncbi:hypothetical protein MINS_03090 [Mycolicibacterium insubricum]|nr:DUF4333 domain-containing protein [Mycolicibacterium insubricum]BBZ64880.1 hypothetical protein MINS_03090 [Mycolicibacterium insubricum]
MKNMTRRAVAGALLVSAALLSGCHGSVSIGKTVSKSDVETKIKQQWNEQVPQQKAKSVACDGDLDAKVDATQHCVVTTSGGEHPVTATVTNVDGSDVNYKWHTDDN